VFERYTEPARQVVVFAQEEARRLGHDYVGTEHILLGLLREQEGIAARVLASLGVTLDGARGHLARTIGRPGAPAAAGQIPFTPAAKKALELPRRYPVDMRHGYIGTEHLLLGLTRLEEGMAAEVLRDRGADPHRIRDEVLRMLDAEAAE